MIDARSSARDAGALAYDELAARYDLVPVENRINRLMRRVSLTHLLAAFPSGFRVLEIGCGTGDEALTLASQGVDVVAFDPSKEMVRIAQRKAENRGLAGRVQFHRAAARDLPRLVDLLRGPFDGAYASFSLAYEADLAPVARGLRDLLREGAQFLASVPSRLCLVEFFLAVGSGHPSYAGRRLGASHGHKVGTRLVPIRTYTPRSFCKALGPHFALDAVEALPAIVPPPYMNQVYSRFNGLAETLERADAKLRTRFPFRTLGDHLLVTLRHRAAL